MKEYYTAKEYKELLGDMVILHDTREQSNGHILDWFDKKKVAHEERALTLGDYGFRIENKWFVDEVFIERKNSLDELASSILSDRFKREIREASTIERKFIIVENGSWEGISEARYNAKYDKKAYWNTLLTYETKYNIHVKFVPKELAGQMIYSICKSVLHSKVLHG